jgi:Fic family protein
MAYEPRFTITSHLLKTLEEIAVLGEKIQAATLQVSWIPALQKDTRARNSHSSTAIEGNPLTLEEVRLLGEGKELFATTERSKREILNYFAGLKFVEKNSKKKTITHEDLFELHRLLASKVMDQGEAGKYRTIQVRVGNHLSPPPFQVSGLMRELLEWWNKKSKALSPVIASGILHYRFEAIHPFADGNGRLGRMLALWELFRRGFDNHHIFSVDEVFWEKRQVYYRQLDLVRTQGEDLTEWLEYTAEAVHLTLERVWERIQGLKGTKGSEKVVLLPRQEKLLTLLRDKGSLSPRELWKALGVSKQGAINLLNPLMKAGLIERIGTKKSGKYILKGE